MSSIPAEFTPGYYDADYFAVPEGKKFRRPDGSTAAWGYSNPEGEWTPALMIANAWKTIFQPKNILDAGAGRGTFIAYARDVGVEAEGFDYSQWAVGEGRYKRCKPEWLKLHDATKPWPYPDRAFDLTTCLDTLEHIYLDDLNSVIDEMLRVAKKWLFLQIAICHPTDRGMPYSLKKGEPVPIELEGCAVAGHVNVQPEEFWIDRFDRDGWLIRYDLENWFKYLVDPKVIANWIQNLILIVERLE